jgi:hypothetical protein
MENCIQIFSASPPLRVQICFHNANSHELQVSDFSSTYEPSVEPLLQRLQHRNLKTFQYQTKFVSTDVEVCRKLHANPPLRDLSGILLRAEELIPGEHPFTSRTSIPQAPVLHFFQLENNAILHTQEIPFFHLSTTNFKDPRYPASHSIPGADGRTS